MKHLTFLAALLLVVSTASGQSPYWSKIPSGTSKRLMSISFGSPNVGYIGGADSLLLKTTNGGATWTPVNASGLAFSLAGPDIVHVNFVNDSTGFLVISNFANPTYSGVMFKTTDGGFNWLPVTSGNIAVYSSYFFDESNGFQVGSAFFAGQAIMKLSGGVWGNYHTFSYLPEEFLYAVDFYDTSIGIAAGTGGFVYRTFNGGLTWDTVKTVVDSTIYSLKFVNDSTILAACANPMGAILISTDTGATWQIDINTLTFAYPTLRSLVTSKKDSFIAVGKVSSGTQGAMLAWHNGSPHFESTDQPMNSVAMSNDSVAFAVGDSGLIVSNLNKLLSVNTLSSAEPLAIIYPNPGDGSFTTKMQSSHTVKVSDLTGRVLYCKNMPSTEHHISLVGHAKGIYIVSLQPLQGKEIIRKVLIQ